MKKQPVALVTGGTCSVGQEICLALAREGFTVLINYNNNDAAADEVAQAIEKAGGKADTCQADVSVPEHRDSLLEYCLENL